MGPEITKTILIGPYVKFLSDSEQQVRSAAFSTLSPICKNKLLSLELIQERILPLFDGAKNGRGKEVYYFWVLESDTGKGMMIYLYVYYFKILLK